ncbi:SPRY domain-containing SOCS box protein 4 [Pteropus alecto]|uniref:SPRY domain-containing SOCS box protein 4 n=1 Tax=Pteropus alecto TaxID=9402 RepID=L5KYX7_PTEAL|nr:SPRY domain-containing SOCS box protein 4 [Pteropus alecto]
MLCHIIITKHNGDVAIRLSQMRKIWLQEAEPLPLMDLCRRSIRLALGRQRLQDISSLPLPQSLKNYLQYQ